MKFLKHLFSKKQPDAANTPAPKQRWNDLEAAILDEIKTRPDAWVMSAGKDGTTLRCFNANRQRVTYVPSIDELSHADSGVAFSEIGDAVGPAFRKEFANWARQRFQEESQKREKEKRALEIGAFRRAYKLD